MFMNCCSYTCNSGAEGSGAEGPCQGNPLPIACAQMICGTCLKLISWNYLELYFDRERDARGIAYAPSVHDQSKQLRPA